jgi:ubiquinone/menaquinone biosynthesis C-methylase UbiE
VCEPLSLNELPNQEKDVSLTRDPVQLFTERARDYVRFIHSSGYPQGLRSYFMYSSLLRSGIRVLDAGCGSGVVTLALRSALISRGYTPELMHCFDLTPAMLDRLRDSLITQEIEGVEVVQANVLELVALPENWNNYDLIVSASMLEYVPRNRFADALSSLRSLLNKNGSLLLFITRDNLLMRFLIGKWWRSNIYTAVELRESFSRAGFSNIAFGRFPVLFSYLGHWGYIVEARS